jgi:hypothetical protein
MALYHVPSLNVPNRMRRVAAIRMRPQPHFQKAYEFSITILGNQLDEWHRSKGSALKNPLKFPCMFFRRRLRPQRRAQPR